MDEQDQSTDGADKWQCPTCDSAWQTRAQARACCKASKTHEPAAEPSILFVKPGSIATEAKNDLRTVGVIVVEMDNPHEAKMVRAVSNLPLSDLSGSALLLAAAKALHGMVEGNFGKDVKRAFSDAVCEAIIAENKKP